MSFLENAYAASPSFIQTAMLNVKAAQLYKQRYGKKYEILAGKFQGNDYLPVDQLEEMQNNQLKILIEHAYTTVPFYHNSYSKLGIIPSDIQTKHDLHKLPIVSKDDIRENFSEFVSTKFKESSLLRGNTSGTTGTPLSVAYDIPTSVVHHVVEWRQKKYGGMDIGEAHASIQGRMIVPKQVEKPPFWRKNYVNNQLFMSSFHLKKENLQSYFNALSSYKILYLEGYPSTIYTLAAFLTESGQIHPLKAVFTSSETLYSWQRSLIEKAFSCPVFDSYGMAERVVYASECESHTGRHLNEDYGITEFVDSNGHPTLKGETGSIVATSLHNFGFPLIRYRTNDVSALALEECSCGRTFPLMDSVTTKQEAIITLPDGRWISPSVLTHPFKPMKNISESQIIQDDLHNIRILIVKRPNYTNEDEVILRRGFKDRIGEEININIEYVNAIQKTETGKFKWVISNITPSFHTNPDSLSGDHNGTESDNNI